MTRLLWDEPATPRRGPRPAFTLEAIARAGIGIADAEGLSAVTMQRVAEVLGVTKMALYRYVPGKAELVALMTDLAMGPPLSAPPGATWRESLDRWARELFTLFLRHPWALEATVGARGIGPNELSWLERAVAALRGTGLTGGETLDAAVLLVGHVRSLALQAGTRGEQALGATMSTLVDLRPDRFPALSEALAHAAATGGQDRALDFGLARILDGVATLIDARRQT